MSTSRLSTSPSASGYWSVSAEPLTSLVFIAPLLVLYEVGVLLVGAEAARNGADVWLRQFLAWAGFGQYFLLPVLTVAILLGWHHTTGRPWRVPRGIYWGMTVECGLLAVCLLLISHLQGALLAAMLPGTVAPSVGASWSLSVTAGTVNLLVAFIGAGIYEELLFRLILLSLIAATVYRLGAARQTSWLVAVVISSVLFSAAHYISEDFALSSFLFRFSAGAFFSLLYVYRGFGITAGTHAAYDILVGLLLKGL